MKKLIAVTILFITTSAMADFQSTPTNEGFSNNANVTTMTVAQALKAKDKTVVAVTGKILRQIDDDEFIFSDGVSEIKIEVDDQAWAGRNVTPNDKITIQGSIDNDAFEKATLEVFKIIK